VDQLPATLLRADLDLKGGSTADPRVVLERLLVGLSQPDPTKPVVLPSKGEKLQIGDISQVTTPFWVPRWPLPFPRTRSR